MEKQKNRLSWEEEHHARYQAADINEKLMMNLHDLNHTLGVLNEGRAGQKRILMILAEVGSITQRDLTRRLRIQPGSASEILAKLEHAGVILRTESETDRRTMNLSLTDEGRRMAQEAADERRQRNSEMFSCLREEEKEEFLSLLERMNGDWRERYHPVGDRRGARCHDHRRGGPEKAKIHP